MTYRGELIDFNSEDSIEDSASDLLAELGFLPNAMRKKYKQFAVPQGGVLWRESKVSRRLKQVRTGLEWHEVTRVNEDFVLLLHYLDEIKQRPGVGPEALRKAAKAYCGDVLLAEGCKHPLTGLAQLLVHSFDMHFDLK